MNRITRSIGRMKDGCTPAPDAVVAKMLKGTLFLRDSPNANGVPVQFRRANKKPAQTRAG
jgi:hypothetical protein